MFKSLVLLLALAAATCSASIVAVKADPLWTPASAEQRASLPTDPNLENVDFSMSDSLHGYGVTALATNFGSMNSKVCQDTQDGYILSLTKGGYKITATRPGSLGELKGVWIFSEMPLPNGTLSCAALIVYGDKFIITISMGRLGPALDENAPLVTAYLARLQVDPLYNIPGDIHRAPETGAKLKY